MKGLVSIALSVASVLWLGGCVAAVIGQAPTSGTSADLRARAPADADGALVGVVRGHFGADAALRSAPIAVSAYSGVVTLRGTVATATLRAAAERSARTVSGVVAVNNQLKVK